MTSLPFSIEAGVGEWLDEPPPARDAGPHEGGLLISSDVYAVLRVGKLENSESLRRSADIACVLRRRAAGPLLFLRPFTFKAREKEQLIKKRGEKNDALLSLFSHLTKSP